MTFTVIFLTGISCEKGNVRPEVQPEQDNVDFSKASVARMISSLPLRREHLDEVYQAVNSSSGNGYDEEYTMTDLLSSPGSGVGETKASKAVESPLRDLITSYLISHYGTRAGESPVEKYLDKLKESDIQIYWPYCDGWDGESYPIITFDPGYGAETNYGYEIEETPDGIRVVDSVLVDEETARTRPVWVINSNDDSSFTPLEMLRSDRELLNGPAYPVTSSGSGNLLIKDFTMLRNYDSWFAGASEFFIKCGYLKGKTSYTEEELKDFYPSVTDMMISVKRKDVGKAIPLDAILIPGMDEKLENVAFLMTEDDGGPKTSWKCSASVKIKSKTYGFDLQIPYNNNDDIVWRGSIATSYFKDKSRVQGRFGDVKVTFELE